MRSGLCSSHHTSSVRLPSHVFTQVAWFGQRGESDVGAIPKQHRNEPVAAANGAEPSLSFAFNRAL